MDAPSGSNPERRGGARCSVVRTSTVRRRTPLRSTRSVWTRPHYDTQTRRILVIGTMVALGRWEEFEEILFQQAIYCGVPAANHAFALTRKVLDGIATEG